MNSDEERIIELYKVRQQGWLDILLICAKFAFCGLLSDSTINMGVFKYSYCIAKHTLPRIPGSKTDILTSIWPIFLPFYCLFV